MKDHSRRQPDASPRSSRPGRRRPAVAAAIGSRRTDHDAITTVPKRGPAPMDPIDREFSATPAAKAGDEREAPVLGLLHRRSSRRRSASSSGRRSSATGAGEFDLSETRGRQDLRRRALAVRHQHRAVQPDHRQDRLRQGDGLRLRLPRQLGDPDDPDADPRQDDEGVQTCSTSARSSSPWATGRSRRWPTRSWRPCSPARRRSG